MVLEECINFLLTSAQHTVFQEMTSRLSVYNLTPVQYAVLYCLWDEDNRNPKEIAERLRLENSTVSGILERMEKKDLIQRNISPTDRRHIQVCLLDKGAMLKNDVIRTVEEVNVDVMARYTKEETETLKNLLRRLDEPPK